MSRDEIKNVFSLRTLYGIPLRVVADAPSDCIAVSPEVMRHIEERGSMLQSHRRKSDDCRESADLVAVMGHAYHSG
jgi:hypothetical protein